MALTKYGSIKDIWKNLTNSKSPLNLTKNRSMIKSTSPLKTINTTLNLITSLEISPKINPRIDLIMNQIWLSLLKINKKKPRTFKVLREK